MRTIYQLQIGNADPYANEVRCFENRADAVAELLHLRDILMHDYDLTEDDLEYDYDDHVSDGSIDVNLEIVPVSLVS